jgi:transcriptional regulator with XRE-family HTH domain
MGKSTRANKFNTGKFNVALYRLRADRNWSQSKMADRLGFTRQYIAQVENGTSVGKLEFWVAVQDLFNIPDSQMWRLIKGELKSQIAPPIHFLCNQTQCKNCKFDICNHTMDVQFAKNFEYDGYVGYWEKKD